VVVEEIEEEEGDQMSFGVIKRLCFSIHFDVDSKEFNQAITDGFLNLAGRGAFHPNPPPERPFHQPHNSLSGILFNLMSLCSLKYHQ
jgi:hypothetical protein